MEKFYRTVAAREGVLLDYLDNDLQTVRRVKQHTGACIAVYETIDEAEYSAE